MNALLRKALCFTLALMTFAAQTAKAQQKTQAAMPAPVPAAVTQAHTVFLSNTGGDPLFSYYSGGVDRGYNDLYTALKNWDHYKLVPSPAEADLILEVRSLANASPTGDPTNAVTYAPELRMQIIDARSRTVLWTLDSYLQGTSLRQGTRDKQFDAAAAALFNQVRQLNGEVLSPAEAKAASRRPGSSHSGWIWFAVLSAAGLGATLAIASHYAGQKPKTPTLPACAPFCPA